MMANAALLDTIRDAYGRVSYSHKTHAKERERLSTRLLWFRRVRLAVVTLTATGAVGILIADPYWLQVTTAILGAISLFMTLYGQGSPLEKSVTAHRRAQDDLWVIKEKYLYLIHDLDSGVITDAEAVVRRDELAEELEKVYHEVPDTSPAAYKKARKAIKETGELSFSDEELDELVPVGLRKVGRAGSQH